MPWRSPPGQDIRNPDSRLTIYPDTYLIFRYPGTGYCAPGYPRNKTLKISNANLMTEQRIYLQPL